MNSAQLRILRKLHVAGQRRQQPCRQAVLDLADPVDSVGLIRTGGLLKWRLHLNLVWRQMRSLSHFFVINAQDVFWFAGVANGAITYCAPCPSWDAVKLTFAGTGNRRPFPDVGHRRVPGI
jgi:hypothetical protein